MTSSPTDTPSTPGPTSVTTPARSLPSPDGKVAGQRSCSAPDADRGLAGVDAGRLDADHDLALAGDGRCDVDDVQDVDVAVLIESHGLGMSGLLDSVEVQYSARIAAGSMLESRLIHMRSS